MQTLLSKITLVCVCAIIWIGCDSSKNATMDPDDRWQRAKNLYADGSYFEAIEDLKILTLQNQGSAYGDSAQILLANSYYNRKEFILAEYEYENMVRSRTGSKLLPQARFRLGMCYYNLSSESRLDQQNTRKAIDAFQSYIEYTPADSLVPNAEAYIRELNNKLAEREYSIASMYMKMGYFRAAIIYFDALLEKYHDSELADDAQLGKALAFYNRKKYPEAYDEIQKFMDRYPSSTRRVEGEQLLSNIQLALDKKQEKK